MIQFKKDTSATFITAHSSQFPTRLSNYFNGELDDVLLAVYEGCETANTGVTNGNPEQGYGNLLEESNRRGIDNALGFQESLWDTQANYWADRFWPYLAQGMNIGTAAYVASDDTYYHYISTNGYGGTNSWKLSSIS